MTTATDQLATTVERRIRSVADYARSLGPDYLDTIVALDRAADHVADGESNGAVHTLIGARRKAPEDAVTLRVRIARLEGYAHALNVMVTADAEAFTIAGV